LSSFTILVPLSCIAGEEGLGGVAARELLVVVVVVVVVVVGVVGADALVVDPDGDGDFGLILGILETPGTIAGDPLFCGVTAGDAGCCFVLVDVAEGVDVVDVTCGFGLLERVAIP